MPSNGLSEIQALSQDDVAGAASKPPLLATARMWTQIALQFICLAWLVMMFTKEDESAFFVPFIGFWLSSLIGWGAQEQLQQHQLDQMQPDERSKIEHMTRKTEEVAAQSGRIIMRAFLVLGAAITLIILGVFALRG